jgi:hypothetical protein
MSAPLKPTQPPLVPDEDNPEVKTADQVADVLGKGGK